MIPFLFWDDWSFVAETCFWDQPQRADQACLKQAALVIHYKIQHRSSCSLVNMFNVINRYQLSTNYVVIICFLTSSQLPLSFASATTPPSRYGPTLVRACNKSETWRNITLYHDHWAISVVHSAVLACNCLIVVELKLETSCFASYDSAVIFWIITSLLPLTQQSPPMGSGCWVKWLFTCFYAWQKTWDHSIPEKMTPLYSCIYYVCSAQAWICLRHSSSRSSSACSMRSRTCSCTWVLITSDQSNCNPPKMGMRMKNK